MPSGGIDLGGTKIEARLFGPDLTTVVHRRVPTPTDSFASFLSALADQVRWLEDRSGCGADLPVGIGLPGTIDPDTGACFAANIPISGQSLRASLGERLGRMLPLLNDAQAFTLSEAYGGAAADIDSTVGLIIGTGIGAGFTHRGTAVSGRNGGALEIGHLPIPATAQAKFDLPLWPCGCGGTGCYETYLSARGLERLGRHTGANTDAPALVEQARAQVPAALRAMEIWAALMVELLHLIQLSIDPQMIVLGGGMSQIPDLATRLQHAAGQRQLGQIQKAAIAIARFGDTSGARGAAVLALRSWPERAF
ncbi:ROK family protein [Rhodobacteraceae bacterium]|nr:ROK family protein [Paracoccaceae bacterium]